jgi:hypothetical protein
MGFEADYYGNFGIPDNWGYEDLHTHPTFSEKVEIEQKLLAYAISLVQAGVWSPNGRPQVKLTELELPHLQNIISLVSRKNYYSSYNDVCNLLNPLLDELKRRQENQ